ncbi:alpha/beta fold hydrolase [Actinocorallia aurea]
MTGGPELPTVVLVHGAFADASVWAGVVGRLQQAGLPTLAAANPLRGLAGDTAYLLSVLDDIPGPVVLVGHCYGGAVATNAGSLAPNVVGLGYVAAVTPDEGEHIAGLLRRFRPSPGMEAITYAAGELVIAEERFARVAAADLPPDQAAVLAVSQRTLAPQAVTERSGRPAWTSVRPWYVIAEADGLLQPSAQRFMAQRMAAAEYRVDGSHLLPRSRPDAIAEIIVHEIG